MGTLAMVSAKINDLTLFSSTTQTSGTLTIDTGDWRTPDLGQITGRAFRAQVTGSSSAVYGTVALSVAKGTLYLRMACKINSSSSNEIIVLDLREGVTAHVNVTAQPSTGILRAYRATTALQATAGNAFLPNTWFVLELFATIADAGGRAVIKVNNVTTAVDFTGDTRNAGTAGTIDNIRFGACSGAPNPFDMYLDDVMVRDDAYCGVGAYYLLPPTANAATMNWTRSGGSAGSEWDLLNEAPPSFTDFIYTDATVANTAAYFEVADVPASPSAITAVMALARARASGGGGAAIKATVDSNGTTSDSASQALDTGEVWVRHILDTDPSGGGAWTEARVNGLKVGVKSA